MLEKELEVILQGIQSGRLAVLSMKKHEKSKNTTKYVIVIQDNAVPKKRSRESAKKRPIKPKDAKKAGKQNKKKVPQEEKVVVEMPPLPPKPNMADITSVTQ